MYNRKMMKQRRNRFRNRGRARGGAPLSLRQEAGLLLGESPQVYYNAKDLDLADGAPVTTFGDVTMVNGPLFDADGWAEGYPTVNLNGTTQYGTEQAEAPNYTNNSKFIWSWSGVSYSAVGAGDEYFLLGVFRSTGVFFMLRRDHTIPDRLEFFIRPNDGDPLYYDNSTELIPTGPIHLVCMWDGDRKLVKVMSAAGVVTIMDVVGIGPIDTISDIDSTFIGRGSSNAEHSPDRLALLTMTRCDDPTEEKVDGLLALLNKHYPIPDIPLKAQIEWMATVEPQPFGDARELQLGDGDPVTELGDWEMLGGTFGPATYDDDGWDGSLPIVRLNGDRGSSVDAENYEHGTPSIWMYSGIRVGTGTAVETIHLEGLNAVYRRFNFNTNQSRLQHLIRNDAGTTEAEFGTPFDTTKPMHAGVVYDGSTVSVAVLNSDGLTVLINNAPVDTAGPSTFNNLFLGNAGTDTIDPSVVVALRCPAAAATQPRLLALLRILNAAYPVGGE